MADQGRAVGGQLERRLGERIGGDLPGAVVPVAQLADALGIVVIAGHRAMPGERHGQRQADVAQAHYGDLGRAQSLLSGRRLGMRVARASAACAPLLRAYSPPARRRSVPHLRAYRIVQSRPRSPVLAMIPFSRHSHPRAGDRHRLG